MAARKFGIAVLGLGRMGAIHLKTLMMSPRAGVKWVMRNDLAACKRLVDVYDNPPQCVTPARLDDILQDETVDGVVISSSSSQHEEQIKAALKAGKAVFSEKPVTTELESTEACYNLAETVGKPLLCAFHRRFDPSFFTVKESLASKSAGNIRLLRCSSHDPEPPPVQYIKTSGGIIKDSTIHDLDMALWLSGSPAKRVYVQGQAFDSQVRSSGDFDLVVVTIHHESGTVSLIDNGRRCAHGYDQRLEVICDNGSYFVTNRATDQVYRHTINSSTTPGIDQSFDTRYPQAYVNEMEHFLDILAGESAPAVTKSDTLSVMRLAEAAWQSAKFGKPVDLS